MSTDLRARMEQARDLIKAKRYNEARAILRTVNHPTATQWLAKLDEIAPEPDADDDPFAYADPVRPAITPLAAIKTGAVPVAAQPKANHSRRNMAIGVALFILVGAGFIYLQLRQAVDNVVGCQYGSEATTALKNFFDTAKTGASAPRLGLTPVILKLQEQQRDFQQASKPDCAKDVTDKIDSGMDHVIEGFQDFAGQRDATANVDMDMAHENFRDAYEAFQQVGTFSPDIRLSDMKLFILGQITPTRTPTSASPRRK